MPFTKDIDAAVYPARDDGGSLDCDFSGDSGLPGMINDDRAIKQLQGRLRQAATVTGLHALNEWSDTASVHDTAEIPPGVRSALMSFDPDLWRSATFPRRCQFPPLTKALPRPPPQPNRRRDVRGLQDFFLPDVWQEIQSWIVDAISNVDSDDPIRNTPLVLGPSACQPWVEAHQGTIWDCRKAHTDGFVTTLDFHAFEHEGDALLVGPVGELRGD